MRRQLVKYPWLTTTLYDLKENWRRRTDLLAISMRKTGEVTVGDLTVETLSETVVPSKVFQRKAEKWDSRPNLPTEPCINTFHIYGLEPPVALRRPQVHMDIRKPAVQLVNQFKKSD